MRIRSLATNALDIGSLVSGCGFKESNIDASRLDKARRFHPQPASETPQALQATHLRGPSRSMTDTS